MAGAIHIQSSTFREVTTTDVSVPPGVKEIKEEQKPFFYHANKVAYAQEALELGLINERGEVQFGCSDLLALDQEDQERLSGFWSESRTFHGEFNWNFHTLLTHLLQVVNRSFPGTRVELGQGTLYALGQSFWKKSLERKIPKELLRSQKWDYFSFPPQCYQFWVYLPPTINLKEDEAKRIQVLVQYLIAAQKISDFPQTLEALLDDFVSLGTSEPNQRINTLREAIDSFLPHVRETYSKGDAQCSPMATLEIALENDVSLHFLFISRYIEPSPFRLDDFRLNLSVEETTLASKLAFSSHTTWEALHDCLLHRLVPTTALSLMPYVLKALGSYSAHLTIAGHVFQGENVEKILVEELKREPEALLTNIESAIFLGFRYLPRGDDALLAYHINILYFLKEHGLPLSNFFENLGSIHPTTAFGSFLYAAQAELMQPSSLYSKLLRWVGMLHAALPHAASDAPQCRVIAERSLLEIQWGSPSLHLVLPWVEEESPIKVSSDILPQVAEVLKAFSPSFYAVSPGEMALKSHSLTQEIYVALCANERFHLAALRLFFILRGGEWKALDERDVLDLPQWVAISEGNQEILSGLARIYENTPFAPSFNAIREKVVALEALTTQQRRLAALRGLVQSSEAKIHEGAWVLYPKLCPEDQRHSFLIALAPQLPEASLMIAVPKVCDVCQDRKDDVKPEERVSLLCAYLKCLHRYPQLFATYGTRLIRLLESLLVADNRLAARLDLPTEVLQKLKYDSLKIDRSNVMQQIERIMRGPKDLSILDHVYLIVDFLKTIPKDEQVWSKFLPLFEQVKNEALLLEGWVALLEKLSTQELLSGVNLKDPPLRCFKTSIKNFSKRVSEEQKTRVAAAYGRVVLYAVKERREEEIKEALPPLDWLLSLLKRDEIWDSFAHLFFRLTSRLTPKPSPAVLGEALWIAPRTLGQATSPHVAPLSRFLAQANVGTLSVEWKVHLAGCILQASLKDPKLLFGHLHKLAVGEEVGFFQECQTLHQRGALEFQSRLKAYQTTGKVPPKAIAPPPKAEEASPDQLRKAIETASSLASRRVVEKILENLRKLPPGEYASWEKLLNIFTDKTPSSLIEEAWKLWQEKHPIVKNPLPRDLQAEELRFLFTLTVKLGVQVCWALPEQHAPVFATLQRGVLAPPTLELIGDMWQLLDYAHSTRLALLLAKIRPLEGGRQFIQKVEKVTALDSSENIFLIRNYSARPYVPQDPDHERILFRWLQTSWPVVISQLDGIEGCNLIRVLTGFQSMQETPEGHSSLMGQIVSMWKDLIFPSLIPDLDHELFLDTTMQLLKKLEELTDTVARLEHLHTFQEGMVDYQKVARFSLEQAGMVALYHLRWAILTLNTCAQVTGSSLDLSPSDCFPAIRIALECLGRQFRFIEKQGPEFSRAIETFVSHLPSLMIFSYEDPPIKQHSLQIIQLLREIPWVMEASQKEAYGLPALLKALCKSVLIAPFTRKKEVIKTVIKIFKTKFSPTVAIPILSVDFLTLLDLHSMNRDDWKYLFDDLSPLNIEGIAVPLYKSIAGQNHQSAVVSSLALARVFNHAERSTTQAMEGMMFNIDSLRSVIPPFSREDQMFPQLLLRVQWILTFTHLLNRTTFSDIIHSKRIKLTEELTQQVLSYISEEPVCSCCIDFLEQVVATGAQLTDVMRKVFVIPSDKSPEVTARLQEFQTRKLNRK